MHPHPADPEVGALAHRVLRDLGPRPDHHGVNAIGDRLQVVVAGVPFDLVRVRVDREDLIPAVPEALVHEVRPVPLGFVDTPVMAIRRSERNSVATSLIVP